MKKIERDYETLLKAYASLERAVDSYKNPWGVGQDYFQLIVCSMMKRFEYCYEMTWRYYRFYMNKKIEKLETRSGKKVFRALFDKKILTTKELERFLVMGKEKKKFICDLDVTLEKKKYTSIPGHYSVMKRVVKRMGP